MFLILSYLLSLSFNTFSNPTIIAIIDNGVYLNSPYIWTSKNCKSDNNIDIGTCVGGYNFVEDNKNLFYSKNLHGSLVYSVLESLQNRFKYYILRPNIKYMFINAGDDLLSRIKSIKFAINNGANIINASWGKYDSGYLNHDLYSVIKGFEGLFVSAAGNNGYSHDLYNSEYTIYKQSFPDGFKNMNKFGSGLSNIVVVGAVDNSGNYAPFSDYGIRSVDIGALGVNYSVNSLKKSILTKIPISYNKTTILTGSYILSGFFLGTLDFVADCNINGKDNYLLLQFSSDGNSFNTVSINNNQKIQYNHNFSQENKSSLYSISLTGSNIDSKLFFRFISFGGKSVNDVCVISDLQISELSMQKQIVNGTSFAAPQVAYLAGLLMDLYPNRTYLEIKDIILKSGIKNKSLADKFTTGSYISFWRAILLGAVYK